jgi:hypothetical protein
MHVYKPCWTWPTSRKDIFMLSNSDPPGNASGVQTVAEAIGGLYCFDCGRAVEQVLLETEALHTPYHKLYSAMRTGRVPIPAVRDASGHWLWSDREIELACQGLASGRKRRAKS